ncbi:MAG: NADH dehydrogenase [Firmicutes bacterium]|nr:NADH dehydrogenase [Bacillota bacterium]
MLEPRLFQYGIAALVAGFGIKAGMVPLHLWLPHAHSSAPTPASALLSGLLIKVGAYGLIRTGELAGWGGAPWLGPVLTILGVCTMLTGVAAALLQSDAKRLLAYHSVSQMGYIILGLGLGLSLGMEGGLGLMGAVYHIVNHALFKAALFLGVGVIYIHTRETSLYRLGGLWRHFPITAFLMLFAVLGITGAPGLNGYASKTLLHHAVSAAAGTGQSWLVWVERLFLLVGVGTAASFTKLYYLMFFGKAVLPAAVKVSDGGSKRLHISMGILALAMVVIGLRPQLLLQALVVPAAEGLGMKTAAELAASLGFWNSGDIMGMLVTLCLGMAVCWAGLKTGAFSWQPPVWLTLEGLGSLAFRGVTAAYHAGEKSYRRARAYVFGAGRTMRSRLLESCRRLDHSRNVILGSIKLSGIGADLALVIVTLVLLVVWSLHSSILRLPAAPLAALMGMLR